AASIFPSRQSKPPSAGNSLRRKWTVTACRVSGSSILNSHPARQTFVQDRSRRNCPETVPLTSSFRPNTGVGSAHWGEVSFLGRKRGPDVLRALRFANFAAEACLHALRCKPDVPLGAADRAAPVAARLSE